MRVLQERHYERVGGTATVTADVRLVAPTNRDLEQAVANGRFRDGLYFHLLYSYLAVFRSHLPPLRERGNDVLLLGERFMRELGAESLSVSPGVRRSSSHLAENRQTCLRKMTAEWNVLKVLLRDPGRPRAAID